MQTKRSRIEDDCGNHVAVCPPVISVDLGGTWMRAAMISADGTCSAILRKKTDRHRPGKDILDDLIGIIRDAGQQVPEVSRLIEAVAIGIPTTLDETGGLASSDNLPTLTGLPLARHLENALSLPVVLFNDAYCFTAGEWYYGKEPVLIRTVSIIFEHNIRAKTIFNGTR